jgi:hypothetical protein
VNWDKLVRQIRRDLTASPKKAAVPGLAVLVALYFWRHGLGLDQPGADDGQRAVAASEVILRRSVDPLKSAKKAGRAFPGKVRRKLADDPRMTPAVFEYRGLIRSPGSGSGHWGTDGDDGGFGSGQPADRSHSPGAETRAWPSARNGGRPSMEISIERASWCLSQAKTERPWRESSFASCKLVFMRCNWSIKAGLTP